MKVNKYLDWMFPFLEWNKPIFGLLAGVGGALLASKSQDKATEAAVQGNEAATELLREQFGETAERLDPFIEGGREAFDIQRAISGAQGPEAQEQAYANYRESPGVQFMRERGERGIERRASARGDLFGGNVMKELSEFNQGIALQDFNDYYNRLGSVTGTGLGAAQALSGVQSSNAAGQANLSQNRGSILSQGQQAQGNIIQSGLSDFAEGLPKAFPKLWG